MSAALVCAFGWPWLMHFSGPLLDCPHCAAHTAELHAQAKAGAK